MESTSFGAFMKKLFSRWTTIAALSIGFATITAIAQTPPVNAPAAIEGLSTRFSTAAALNGWQQHSVQGFSNKWAAPSVENGALVLRPTSSGWFEDMQAGHLYREVDGNFIVTTRIKVSGTKQALPQRSFSLAGLFIRAPRPGLTADNWQPGKENWMFFSIGTAFPAGAPQFEVKTTYNSLSTLYIGDASRAYAGGPQWVDLRIARQGELFTLLQRTQGSNEFSVVEQFIRPDLPAKLNVGLTAYADWDSAAPIYPDFRRYNTQAPAQNADLVAYVESIDFRRPTVDRFPVATLDPKVSFMPEVSQRRLEDLTRK
jgi:hypothetical protein